MRGRRLGASSPRVREEALEFALYLMMQSVECCRRSQRGTPSTCMCVVGGAGPVPCRKTFGLIRRVYKSSVPIFGSRSEGGGERGLHGGRCSSEAATQRSGV